MADINDRLDRLHRREAFDQRVAKPGGSAPTEPEYAGVAAAPDVQQSRAGLPQGAPARAVPAHPAPAQAAPGNTAPAHTAAVQPGWAQPGSARSGTARPGSAQPGSAQSGSAQPGSVQQWARSGLPQRAPGQAAAAHRLPAGAAWVAPPETAEPSSAQPAPEPKPARPAAAAPRPAGVDDRLGEVLDAVAEVVRRHRGLSVMVAIADGRPGRPIIRVTERAGEVKTSVVMTGAEPTPRPEPAPGPGPEPEPRRQGGRHAAPAAEEDPPLRHTPPARNSWHYSLWSGDRAAAAGAADRPTEHGGLRLVPDLEPAAEVEPAVGADTSQVVSRLAQLLRDDPSLASSWGREAPDS